MHFAMPSATESPFVLRALKSVALADGEVEARERHLLELAQQMLPLEEEVDLDTLEPITPEELAAKITNPDLRRALVERMVLMTVLDEELRPEELRTVEAFAEAFGIEEPALKSLQKGLDGHLRLMAMDFARRSFMADKVGSMLRNKGLGALLQTAKQAMGLDSELAARSRALGELPEGTLGRAYFDFIKQNGFALAGEKGGTPGEMMFHDIGHVLAGYATTPRDEMRTAAFQAGYMGERGLTMLLMIIPLFHLGMDVHPLGVEPTRGMFDLDTAFAAFRRGKALKVNLAFWDPWPHMARPLEEVRKELHIEPLEA